MVGDDDARRLAEDLSGVEIVRNTYFVTCPLCGSNLDPGERCDCEEGRNHHEQIQDLQSEGRILRLEAERLRERLRMGIHEETLSDKRGSPEIY